MKKQGYTLKDLDKLAVTKEEVFRMYPNYTNKAYLKRAMNDILTDYGAKPKKKWSKMLSCPQFKELREFLGDPLLDPLGKEFL